MVLSITKSVMLGVFDLGEGGEVDAAQNPVC